MLPSEPVSRPSTIRNPHDHRPLRSRRRTQVASTAGKLHPAIRLMPANSAALDMPMRHAPYRTNPRLTIWMNAASISTACPVEAQSVCYAYPAAKVTVSIAAPSTPLAP